MSVMGCRWEWNGGYGGLAPYNVKKIWKLYLTSGIFIHQKHDKPRVIDFTTVIHKKRENMRLPTEKGKNRGNPRKMAKIAVIRGKMAKNAVFRCSVYTLKLTFP